MKYPVPLILLAVAVPASLPAQVRLSAMVSASGGTALVHDQINQDIKVDQLLNPALILGASLPVAPKDRLGVELGLGFAKTHIMESGLGTFPGPSYRTFTATLGYEGPIVWRFRYRASAGVLKYMPDKEGVFRDGGPAVLLLGVAVDYRWPIRAPFDLTARLQYDFHRFTTTTLEQAGYGRSQDVHRIGLGIGIGFTRQ
jgi:hypothetical protein